MQNAQREEQRLSLCESVAAKADDCESGKHKQNQFARELIADPSAGRTKQHGRNGHGADDRSCRAQGDSGFFQMQRHQRIHKIERKR